MEDHIKNKIKELFDLTPKNVSVAWGKKNINGSYVNENCFVFIVEEKKPLDELLENEILPTSIEISGVSYKTDVRNNGKIRIISCSENIVNSCYDWLTVPPINQDVTRPLKGGVSISSIDTIDYVGTMGIIAVDIETNALVGVTNAHIQVNNMLYTNEREIGNEDSSENNLTFQPGELSIVDMNQDVIGKLIRYSPISLLRPNRTDGALISLNSKDISTRESFKQCGLSYDLPMTFATSLEIDDILSTNPKIFSSGRTSGAKENTPCGLVITAIEAMVYINGYVQNFNGVVEFKNVICFEREYSDCEYPISAGDSGSALIADFDGDWKIIGLVFAGSDNTGYACRIDMVSADLGIKAWDGELKNYFNMSDSKKITLPGRSGAKILICNNEKYWQIGSTFETFAC